MKDTRLYNFDVLRITAAFMVVMIHVSGYFLINTDLTLFDTYFVSVFSSLVRSAVPLFFMISGVVFLNPTKDFTFKYLINKIVRLFVVLFVWNLLYALIDTWNDFTLYDFLKRTWKGHFHMWFFEYMIGVYILIPVMKALVEYKDGKFIPYYIVVFFLFGIIRTTFNAIPYFNEEIRIITSKVHVEFCDFCGYFMLGYFLSKIKMKLPPYVYLNGYLLMVALHFTIISVLDIQLIGADAFTIFIFIESAMLFLLFRDLSVRTKNINLLLLMSKATLGVYLIHPLFLENFKIGFIDVLPVYFSLPVLYVIILSLSFSASVLLNKLPVVNKWIV